jgi:NAD-dependent deacetylase
MLDDFQAVARLLNHSGRVLFITGAGVSAESGIPTFRGSTAAFPNGQTEDGLPFEEALSGSVFRRNPELSWKYFFQLERSLRGKEPNPAHRAIAALQRPGRSICVVTQNIDGLHQNAGSRCVIELHGNLRRLICSRCDYRSSPDTYEGLPTLPRCPECLAILRPDIVLYEEMLPAAALEQFDREQGRGFDLVFSVGTTSIFHYVVAPVFTAAHRGIPTIEINPEETSVSDLVRFRFAAAAGPTLQKLWQAAEADSTSAANIRQP